jgi:tryptophan synthase alpha chain
MSALADTFHRIRAEGRGGLVTYLTAGDPDAGASVDLLVAVARAGADVLEVGVPFSDPLADGPVIQRASERALARGMTLAGTLEVIRGVRASVRTPIVLFTYANPVLRMTPQAFARDAADSGVDGVLILDYPVEEAGPLREPLIEAGLDPVFLISPTTSPDRIRRSSDLGRGFLYVISRLGVTGAQRELADGVSAVVQRVRAAAHLPIALGFGIATPGHVAQACRMADAAVVGSALVSVVAEHGGSPDLCATASEYVRWLKSEL